MNPNRRTPSARAAALAALALLAASPALAVPPSARGGSTATTTRGRHRGRLVTVLPDGTLREPSADRAEATIGTDVLDAGDWSWELGAGGSASSVGGLNSAGVEGPSTSLAHGFGHGFQLGIESDGWQASRVQQGTAATAVTESGLGGARVGFEQRLRGDSSHVAVAVAGGVRLPAALDSPGTHTTEASLALPVSAPLGPHAHWGAMLAGEWAGDALDDGHHLNGVASAEVVRSLRGEWSGWLEALTVWSGETGRAWLGAVDGGVEGDLLPHVGLRLGLSSGIGGGRADVGVVGGVSLHS